MIIKNGIDVYKITENDVTIAPSINDNGNIEISITIIRDSIPTWTGECGYDLEMSGKFTKDERYEFLREFSRLIKLAMSNSEIIDLHILCHKAFQNYMNKITVNNPRKVVIPKMNAESILHNEIEYVEIYLKSDMFIITQQIGENKYAVSFIYTNKDENKTFIVLFKPYAGYKSDRYMNDFVNFFMNEAHNISYDRVIDIDTVKANVCDFEIYPKELKEQED